MIAFKSVLITYLGLALMTIGAILLIVCRLVGWQSNAELLIGLILIVVGFVWHVLQQKRGEKY